MDQSLHIDIDGHARIKTIITDLQASDKQVEIASARALNKTALWLRTQTTREVSKQKRIPQKLIRERLQILRANRKQLTAFIKAKLYGIRPEKLGTIRQTKKGTQVKSHTFDGAFVAQMPKAEQASIYKRKSKARLPIRSMRIPIADESEQVMEQLLDQKMMERFETLFYHELKYLLQKGKR